LALAFITSNRLSIPHGFSTRPGGVSTGPYQSLNLGYSVGDLKQRVDENFERFFQSASTTKDHIRTVAQVHGDQVLQFGPRAPARAPEADALWTEHPGIAVDGGHWYHHCATLNITLDPAKPRDARW